MWKPEQRERCFVFHGPVLYEGTVKYIYSPDTRLIKKDKHEEVTLREFDNEQLGVPVPEELQTQELYYVHYKGWPKSWDEWVELKRAKPYNAENIRKCKELKIDALRLSKSGEVKKVEIEVQANDYKNFEPAIAFPSKSDPNYQEAQAFLITAPFFVDVPKDLKERLVDDWEKVKVNNLCLRLPAKVSIRKIFLEFRKSYTLIVRMFKATSGSNHGSGPSISHNEALMQSISSFSKSYSELSFVQLQELVNDYVLYASFLDDLIESFTEFFNKNLMNLLLYHDDEKKHVIKTVHKAKDYTEVFGVEHLLRMLAVLPDLIAQFEMDFQARNVAKFYIQSFYFFIYERIDSYENSYIEHK